MDKLDSLKRGTVGQWIKMVREVCNDSQQAMADLTGYSKRQIWDFEHDKIHPAQDWIEKFVIAYMMTTSEERAFRYIHANTQKKTISFDLKYYDNAQQELIKLLFAVLNTMQPREIEVVKHNLQGIEWSTS